MKRTVVIVVEGGRIQDIYADSTDIRVVVKNFDDADDQTSPPEASRDWPSHVIAPQAIEGLVSQPA